MSDFFNVIIARYDVPGRYNSVLTCTNPLIYTKRDRDGFYLYIDNQIRFQLADCLGVDVKSMNSFIEHIESLIVIRQNFWIETRDSRHELNPHRAPDNQVYEGPY